MPYYIILIVIVVIVILASLTIKAFDKSMKATGENYQLKPNYRKGEGFQTNKFLTNSSTLVYIPKKTNNPITKLLEEKRATINPVAEIVKEEDKIVKAVEATNKDAVDPTIPEQSILINKPRDQEHEVLILDPPKERFRLKSTKTKSQMAKTIASGIPNYMD